MNVFRMFVWLFLLTAGFYPLLVTTIGTVLMEKQVNGSLISSNDKLVGSALIGQKFTSDKYFWSRPSAVDYNPLASGGSNLGPTSLSLKDQVLERQSHYAPHSLEEIPSDLIYASGSGIDPHITPKAASFQMERVAKARGLDKETLAFLIKRSSYKRPFFFLSVPRVNVLELNVSLDELRNE